MHHCPNDTYEILKPCLSAVPLPTQWQVFSDSNSIEYCQLMNDLSLSGMCYVSKSIAIRTDLSWSILVQGQKVPTTCKFLAHFPPALALSDQASKMVETLNRAFICPGNPDQEFVNVCRKRGGTIKGQRENGDMVAFIDEHLVTDSRGQSHPCTVRRVDCDILCEPSAQCPQRCRSCQGFRSTLRSSVSRIHEDNRTSATSHTKYSNLSPGEKDSRLSNLHRSFRLVKQQVRRLEAKVGRLIEKEGISLEEEDATDLSAIFNEVGPTVNKSYPPDSLQRIFWDQQMKYNNLKDKGQMRWHPIVVRFALNLKYVSTSAYRAIRQGGIINLPSERTLSDYTTGLRGHIVV